MIPNSAGPRPFSFTRLVESFASDLRLALRSLVRSPGFTITAVASLALAIGASAAAFSVIDAVRFRALPFKDGERLVLLSELPVDDAIIAKVPSPSSASSRECRSACDVSYITFDQVLKRYPFRSLDAVAAYTSGGKALGTKGEPVLVTGGVVSENLFRLLGVQPMIGRAFTPEDDRLGAVPVTLLSHELWTSQFGQDPSTLGRIVKLSDTQYTVIGIMPPGFSHEVASQFWLPAVPTLDPSTRPSIRTLTVIGRLAKGATLAQLKAELASVQPAIAAPAPGRTAAPATRLDAAPLRDRYTSSTKSHDLIFAAIVACVLLIACANLANLLLVRTLHQQRELAIRVALGGGVGRVARFLLAQNLLIVLLAALTGLLLARSSLSLLQSVEVLNSLRPGGMEYRLDVRVVLFAVALALAAGILLSVITARLVSRLDAQRLLREGAPAAGGGRWGSRAQQVFVVAQVASAVVLLTGAGLMAKTVLRLSHVDLGFDAAQVVQGTPSFPHPWRVKETYVPMSARILDDLGRVPGVATAALRANVPLGARGTPPVITIDGESAPLPPGVAPEGSYSVSPGYFDVLGVRIVRGRAFSDQDREAGIPVAIVNEWAAKRWWQGVDPVGRTVRVDTAPSLPVTLTIVGVVRDNKAAQPNILLAEDGPELYRPYLQAPSAFPSFFLRATAAPATILRPVREVLVRDVPDRPVFASPLAEQVANQLQGVKTNAMQILSFAVIGLFLALLGIHGVLAYAVGRRVREIGIRGALGATRGRIGVMVLRDASRLTIAGLAVGLIVARATTGVIAELLHGTSPTDPSVYVAVALGVLAVSLVASWLPARRAARVDPALALRAP